MAKRILKDIKVDNLSKGESIITLQIWSDVPYLDNDFVNRLLEEEKEVDSTQNDKVYYEIRDKIDKLSKSYEQEVTPDMSEHDMFVTTIQEAIAKDISRNCLSVVRPTIESLLKDRKNPPKADLQNHVVDITKLIDLMKSHLSYIPTVQERNKLMFRILDDLKTYCIMGDKFLKLEHFSNYWKFREQFEPTNSYEVGIKGKIQLPPLK